MEEWEGRFFDEPGSCPLCGSDERTRWDSINRIFCRLISNNNEGFDEVEVVVKRFRCKVCGHVYEAEAPFYPDTDYGKPVVDLCLYLAASNPYHRVEQILMDFGIQVDRDTVRNYAILFEEKLEELAGIKLMGETIGVNFVRALFECGTIEELKEKRGEEFFESCHDETYPAKKGAKKEMREENARRKFEDRKKIPYPEAFCTALSYVPSHEFYGSSVIRDSHFNYILAKVLLAPTEGADWRVTDRHPSYQEFDAWKCLLHRFRGESRDDQILKRLKDAFPHLVPDYLSERYEEFQAEKLDELKRDRPDLFDDKGEFKGSLTTNAMEGGNWRIKYELRTPYSVLESISGRVNLIMLKESLHTFQNGEPCESWAHQHAEFQLEKVMSIKLERTPQFSSQIPLDRQEEVITGGVNKQIKIMNTQSPAAVV